MTLRLAVMWAAGILANVAIWAYVIAEICCNAIYGG